MSPRSDFGRVGSRESRRHCCREYSKLRAKYVNTYSDDFGAPTRVDIRPCHVDRECLYKLNCAKIIILGGL